MVQIIRSLAALCIAEGFFELLIPDGGMKRQMRTVCGLMVTVHIARLITALFGR